MSKKQKTCIHTDVFPVIDNQVKLIKRIYIIHEFLDKFEEKNSTFNMSGWSKLGITTDKHKIFDNQILVQETEIWANNKYLVKENVYSKTDSDFNKYKFINNFVDEKDLRVNTDVLKNAETAKTLFELMRINYSTMIIDKDENLKIICPDFREDMKFDSNNGELIYARALDEKGRIIFAVEKI